MDRIKCDPSCTRVRLIILQGNVLFWSGRGIDRRAAYDSISICHGKWALFRLTKLYPRISGKRDCSNRGGCTDEHKKLRDNLRKRSPAVLNNYRRLLPCRLGCGLLQIAEFDFTATLSHQGILIFRLFRFEHRCEVTVLLICLIDIFHRVDRSPSSRAVLCRAKLTVFC